MTSVDCRCDPSSTCGYCLRNAKPWFGFMAGQAQGTVRGQDSERVDNEDVAQREVDKADRGV